MSIFQLRPLSKTDRDWVKDFTIRHWGSDMMVVHGDVFYISQQPGFVAESSGNNVGLVTYHIANGECEITSLDSLREGIGIGSALILAVKDVALKAHCTRLYLNTTNDNLNALRFYQKRGFVLVKLRPGAVIESRKQKPEIPLLGQGGIPIRDEIELEIILSPQTD